MHCEVKGPEKWECMTEVHNTSGESPLDCMKYEDGTHKRQALHNIGLPADVIERTLSWSDRLSLRETDFQFHASKTVIQKSHPRLLQR